MNKNAKTNKSTMFAIIILVILVFFAVQYISTGKLDITSSGMQIGTNYCDVVRECTTDCQSICDTYSSCTVKAFEDRQIACITGEQRINIQIETSPSNLNSDALGGNSNEI